MLALVASKQEQIRTLCRNNHVRRLDLFGSATGAQFHGQDSDLDFVVEFEPLEPTAYKRAYFSLLAGLEQLFERPIDLVTEPSLRNPFFRQSLEETRQPIYGWPGPKLVMDALFACRAIRSFTNEKTLDQYGQDLMLRSAVERQFEIIGEALRRLSATDSNILSAISSLGTIIAFRNIIAHGYDVLDNKVVWGVIEEDLPILSGELEQLLARLTSR